MRKVEFVETSVLCNFLDVPGKNQDRDAVRRSMREKVGEGVQLIVPISAVVETGNHITHLQDGAVRRACAERFVKTLRAIADNEAPWVLHQVAWNEHFFTKLCDGVAGTGPFVECATQGLGCGTSPSSSSASSTLGARRSSGRACGRSTPSSPPTPHERAGSLPADSAPVPTAGETRRRSCGGAEERERFLHEPVVVEEKLDGANVMLWLDGEGLVQTAGRSGADGMDRAGQLGRLRAWAAERSDRLRALLTADRVLYAEWLYLTHTVRYDRLPDLLVGADLYTPDIGFLAVDERDRRLGQAGVTTPPRLFSGALEGEERLLTLFGVSAFGSEPAEGLVLRRERRGRLLERAKVLRPGLMRVGDDHWGGAPRRNALDERGAGIAR